MGKDKLRRFKEIQTFPNVIEARFEEIFNTDHPLKGNWREKIFSNSFPIVIELGCGKGEYAVGLASQFPEKNFIGVDIKGNRMWVGAKQALQMGLKNVLFLRTRIEFINSFFGEQEIDEIWITFPDPQEANSRKNKRLTSSVFLKKYQLFLKDTAIIHLKTDSRALYQYTLNLIKWNHLKINECTDDLYKSSLITDNFNTKTYYEQKFLEQGSPIHYIQFTLDGKKEIDEPR